MDKNITHVNKTKKTVTQKLWVVGQYRHGKHKLSKSNKLLNGVVWDFQGVFSEKSQAIKACRNWRYFVFSATLGEELSDESCQEESAFYPIER